MGNPDSFSRCAQLETRGSVYLVIGILEIAKLLVITGCEEVIGILKIA